MAKRLLVEGRCAYCGALFASTRRRTQKHCSLLCARRNKRRFVTDLETGCIMPDRKPATPGYPIYKHNGRVWQAARLIWTEQVGPIPAGLTIDHLCRNRMCVNVAHLELVTITENIRRSPRVKLNEEKVRAIRASDEPYRVLAERYGVTKDTIYQVRAGTVWKLDEPPLLRHQTRISGNQ